MTDIDKARQLFQDAGLVFPIVPNELTAQLREQGPWLFSTRPIDVSPYNLQHYVHEVQYTQVKNYALLSHSGHGVNSYAIQYYLVLNPLHMFLHLGWGGAYMDGRAADTIRDCFLIADRIVTAAQKVGSFQAGESLTVVGSDFYGSYWLPPGESRREKNTSREDILDVEPMVALTEALGWLTPLAE